MSNYLMPPWTSAKCTKIKPWKRRVKDLTQIFIGTFVFFFLNNAGETAFHFIKRYRHILHVKVWYTQLAYYLYCNSTTFFLRVKWENMNNCRFWPHVMEIHPYLCKVEGQVNKKGGWRNTEEWSRLNNLSKKSRPNNTLRPQERMAFSVGEPVISASPPSCTKEKHRCNCVKHGRLVFAIGKCYGWYFNSIPRLPPGGCPVQVSNILRARTSNIRQADCFRS